MKKLVAALATVCVVAATAVGSAIADPDAGTVIDKGFDCAVFDGNGSLFLTTNSTLTVYSNHQGSKAVLHCEGFGAPAAFLQHYNYDRTGLLCGSEQFGSTDWWDNKVGRAGHSQLRCTFTLDNGDVPSAASGGVAGIG